VSASIENYTQGVTFEMAKNKTTRRHTFPGEIDAPVVLEWLANPIRPPNDLIEKWVTIEGILQRQFPPDGELGREISELINKEINRLGLAWTWRATPTNTGYDLEFGLALDKEKVKKWTEPDKTLVTVIPFARKLASEGMLSRFRKCENKDCENKGRGGWFYAKLEHQRFHSNECRRSALAVDPGWRRQRADWVREYRRTKKLLAKKKKKGGK
jgi:hypothetical protein